MPSPARPTDEVLIEAARAHVLRLCGPGKAPRVIIIRVEGVRDPIKIPVMPSCWSANATATSQPAGEPFVPTETQALILETLTGRALRTDGLLVAGGLNRSQLFAKPGGIQELMERGDVAHHKRVGYYRPDAPPDEMVIGSTT